MTPLPKTAPLDQAPKLSTELSVTGRWTATTPDGWFFRSSDGRVLRDEWQRIFDDAKAFEGVLSTEVNHAIGQDAVLIHHVFESPTAMARYLETIAANHRAALADVAHPDLHLIRGVHVPDTIRQAVRGAAVSAAFGSYLFGWHKHDHQRPDPDNAIQVTAKWTAKPGHTRSELEHWWRTVAREAWTLEEGLVRFEAYAVEGEEALIVHETFTNTSELRFHLTRGTASQYKAPLDEVAAPECYYFRGPVSWDIRTYSKFMNLPATYTQRVLQHNAPAGSWSDGRIPRYA